MRLHDALGGNGSAENFERTAAKVFGKINQLHSETGIRLINAKSINRFLIGEPFERDRDFNIEGDLPETSEQCLDQFVDILAFDKRHLDIDLSKLKLPIRPLVLIGGISYSLYLLHQYIGVSLIALLKRGANVPDLVAASIAALACGLLAFTLTRMVEVKRPTRNII